MVIMQSWPVGSSHVTMRRGCRPLIEDKWSLLVVSMLGPGPKRFTELKRVSATSASGC